MTVEVGAPPEREGENPGAPASDAVVLETLPARRGLDELPDDWSRLVQSGPHSVFETPLWVVNYWRHRTAERGRLTFVVGRSSSGEIVGLVPMVHRAHFGLAPTRSAVHATGEYPSDWLCRPGYGSRFAAAVCDAFLSRPGARTRLALSVVPESSEMLRSMIEECDRRELHYQLRPARRIAYVDTSATAAQPVPVHGKYRRELGRRWRSLQQLGPSSFETCSTVVDVEDCFAAFERVENGSWKGHAGTAIVSNPRTHAFWWQLARDAAEQGCLRLDLLRLGGEVISGQLGLVYSRRYYCLKVGYDERYRAYGPGALMTQQVVRRCVEDPEVDVYDFAGTAQPYMWNWTGRSYETWTLDAGAPPRRVAPWSRDRSGLRGDPTWRRPTTCRR
jgi:CelD/BcsL family acetyltransferase involved in cellulose biosynthesis